MNANRVIYKKNVSEPWFSLINLGLKKVEGRLGKGDFVKMKKDDIVIWENNDLGFHREVKTYITSIHKYSSFAEYLENEGLEKTLPGINDLEQGKAVYYKYFTPEQENEFNVLAIRLGEGNSNN